MIVGIFAAGICLGCYPPPPPPTPSSVAISASAASIRPLGTGGPNTTTITVSASNPVTANVNVTLTIASWTSGGHTSHSGTEPLGSLAQISGQTNASGQFTTTYSASRFGGDVRISASLAGFTVAKVIQVRVPGLSKLDPNSEYLLIGSTATHPVNHWGISAAVAGANSIALDYHATFFPNDTTVLPNLRVNFNDMSLQHGGKFDIAGNWCVSCSHFEHLVGANIDVRNNNIPVANRPGLEQMFIDSGSPNFLDEGNHWHLRY